MLVNESCVTEAVWSELFNRVHRFPTASKHQPLHVPPLGSSQRHNAGFGEHVQRHWVDSLQIIKFDAPVFKLIYIYPFKAYGTIKDNKFTPDLPNFIFSILLEKLLLKLKISLKVKFQTRLIIYLLVYQNKASFAITACFTNLQDFN